MFDHLCLTGGAIGSGPPMAVGAAVAALHRQVINLQADGSAMYTLQVRLVRPRAGQSFVGLRDHPKLADGPQRLGLLSSSSYVGNFMLQLLRAAKGGSTTVSLHHAQQHSAAVNLCLRVHMQPTQGWAGR